MAEIVVAKKAKVKGAPPSKRAGANDSPARSAYWNSGRLMERKIRNLMRCCGMTRAEATKRWLSTRKKRVRRTGVLTALAA